MQREEILAIVKQNIIEVLDEIQESDIDESKSMKDYGADSLEMVEVVSRSMKQLKIKVPRTELANIQNIAGLIDLFKAHADKS